MNNNLIKNFKENKFFAVGNDVFDINKIENNNLHYCRFGGGFSQKISMDDKQLNKDYVSGKITLLNKIPTVYQSAELYLDGWLDDENLEAYTLKFHNWNGWSHLMSTKKIQNMDYQMVYIKILIFLKSLIMIPLP
mgnify:CR=1 FL=1